MFKEILQALRGSDTLTEMIKQLGEMIDSGKWMFAQSAEALMHRSDWEEKAQIVYQRDKEINHIEQSIREEVITHLTVGYKSDLSACLVLMSVVKDAERIGDYCKNIFEVAKFYQREFKHAEYWRTLDEIRKDTLPVFDDAKKSFLDADSKLAYQTMESAGKLRGRCDVIIRQLLSVHDQIAPDEAVSYVLLARFYKRVAAHLGNIASSVVSPLPLLDYRGNKLQDEENNQ